ncbi:PKD domain-containing protein [Leptothrix sp. BB-3]
MNSRHITLALQTVIAMVISSLAACGGGGGGGSAGPAPTNRPPVAVAGQGQSVQVAATVQLDGTGSTDPDGDSLTYSWTLTTKPAGSVATLSNATSPRPTFVADLAGTYTANLVVNDGRLNSAVATVTSSVATANVAPVANAGLSQNVTTGSSVILNGSASTDANGDTLTYSWAIVSRPPGSNATLSTASGISVTFTADVAGTYSANLIVNDGTFNSSASTVSITASAANSTPVANAGPAQSVTTGTNVTVSGASSTDANGDLLTYRWTLTAKPTGSSATLTSSNAVSTSFVADLAGVYVASLIVNDGTVDSSASTVSVTASFVNPPLPVGSGTFAQEFPFGRFYSVNESNGILTAQATACRGFSAADIQPNGRVLATATSSNIVQEIDVISGTCRDLFSVEAPMTAIAVASDGTIVTVSQATTFGARQIYQYSPAGIQLSKVSASGSSGLIGVSNFTNPNALAFAPDGSLYATALGTVWQLNPNTGVGVLRAVGIQTTGDIDIDSSGNLRTISFGTLYIYSTSTWAQISSKLLERDIFGFSPLVHR